MASPERMEIATMRDKDYPTRETAGSFSDLGDPTKVHGILATSKSMADAPSDDTEEGLTDVNPDSITDTNLDSEVHLEATSTLAKYRVNGKFWSRAYRVLKCGLKTPFASPKLWFIIAFNLLCQIVGAYLIQAHLYVVATGTGSAYPGIAGCLKSGCGGVKAPGNWDWVQAYMRQWGWLFVLSMFFVVLMSYTGDLINILMRKNAAEFLQNRLLADNKLCFRMIVEAKIDNIDQRITSDLQIVMDGFTCVLFGNTPDYVAYPLIFAITRFTTALVKAFSLSGNMQLVRVRLQCIGVVFAFVFVAVMAYIVPINQISKIFYRGQKYEGDFRTTHTKCVLNCESISTMAGEKAESVVATLQFKRVDANNKLYYAWQAALLVFRLFVTLAYPAGSYVCLVLTKTRDSTTANFFQKQFGDVFEYMLYLPVMFMRLAYAAGATHRVGEVLETMDLLESRPMGTGLAVLEDNLNVIELKNVYANPPIKKDIDPTSEEVSGPRFGEEAGLQDAPLFMGVNFKVKKGESMCIIGPSGCGKSSLLRVVAGLWGVDKGTIVRPKKTGAGGMFFLPQRAYTFPGTLREQVEYPNHHGDSEGDDDDRLRNVLSLVYLTHLLDRYGLDTHVDFSAILSLSEMQRLNFARLFYQRPVFCLADEATSSLDLALESYLLAKCNEYGISLLSVAHRPSVLPHHTWILNYEVKSHSWSQILTKRFPGVSEIFPSAGINPSMGQGFMEPEQHAQKPEGMTVRFWGRLIRTFRFGFKRLLSQGPFFALVMLGAMIVYGYLQILIFDKYGTSIIINNVIGKNAQKTPDYKAAFDFAFKIIGISVIAAICQSLSCWLGSLLGVKIQRGIIGEFHRKYFVDGVPYELNRVTNLAGVDQRMVQDLSGYREAVAWIFGNPFAFFNYHVGFLPLTIPFIMLTVYAFQLSWQLAIFMFSFMVFAFVCQGFASIFTSPRVEVRQAQEGDLRQHLGRIMQNIESITFFGGYYKENQTCTSLLHKMIATRFSYSLVAILATIPTITMYYWLQTGIYVMSAVVIHSDPTSINLANFFTGVAFNIIWAKQVFFLIQAAGSLGIVVGFTHRVVEVLEKLEKSTLAVKHKQGNLKIVEDGNVSFDAVTIQVPSAHYANARMLLSNFTAKLPPSMCVGGMGKSSVLRVLRGLWRPTASSGKITRPPLGKGGIFFVPQSSYTTQGTLASQVVYPNRVADDKPSNAELVSILNEIGLGAIVKRWGLHKMVNWENVLSGGEAQRLGFARVLYHLPKYAVLDETTSALDMSNEERCMNALLKRGIILLSFASRPSIFNYHTQAVHISKGSYTITGAETSSGTDCVWVSVNRAVNGKLIPLGHKTKISPIPADADDLCTAVQAKLGLTSPSNQYEVLSPGAEPSETRFMDPDARIECTTAANAYTVIVP
eukprot:gb/GEZN01000427.1/.p1 GENE.gb/GEZN01000427.1/~~gb/GEZN01000427.1/.p1  ORF type:complete len:1445 (+),score=226.17 gb/GEZN01000427.1/:111-4337(+)